MRLLLPAWLLGCGADAPGEDLAPLPRWADVVLSAPTATGEPPRDAALAANGARGGGWNQGGLDVYSLSLEPSDELVLAWSDRVLVDGPGPDLVVFENAFELADGSARFMDPVIVEVSPDGERWVAFPHDYVADDELEWVADPAAWQGFAGLTPVLLHEEDNPVDPFDPERAGGDAFDLAELPSGPVTDDVLAHGVIAVRLTSAAARINPDTGEPYPKDVISNGADIDAVYGATLAAP